VRVLTVGVPARGPYNNSVHTVLLTWWNQQGCWHDQSLHMLSPVYVVDLVGVLALLAVLLVRFISEDLNPFSSTCVVLTGLCNMATVHHTIGTNNVMEKRSGWLHLSEGSCLKIFAWATTEAQIPTDHRRQSSQLF